MISLNAFKSKKYQTFQEMSDAFFNITKALWINKTHNELILKAEDLKEIFKMQNYLLRKVLEIHQSERNIDQTVEETISNHLNISHLRNQLNGVYSYHHIYYMDDDSDYFFVGDIHSDTFIFEAILRESRFFERVFNNEPFKVVFLGDYVDRGNNHLKTIETLLLLKLLFPSHVYLLMGNHDIGHIEEGEVTLYLRKAEEEKDYFYYHLNELHENHKDFDDDLLELYLKFMNTLNVTAYIITKKNTLMAVHGGIPRPDENDEFKYIESHKQMTDETIDHMNFRIRDCIIWSDPSIQINKPTLANRRFKFYENQLTNFHDTFGFDTLIRGHQAMEDGCVPLFNGKLYTIFSSGAIYHNELNVNTDTAYDFITPKILRYNKVKGLPLEEIDLNKKGQ